MVRSYEDAAAEDSSTSTTICMHVSGMKLWNLNKIIVAYFEK